MNPSVLFVTFVLSVSTALDLESGEWRGMAKMDGRAEFGVMGLGVMGENLALNIEDHGFSVAVWNRDPERTGEFLAAHAAGRFTGAATLGEFVQCLQPPRRILMMIKAGDPIDHAIRNLEPLLQKGDILIDGGNSDFRDTRRRESELRSSEIHFVGIGVSGGESGARFGPSIMAGGDGESYERLKPVLEAIAARTSYGPCVSRVGPDGAGHFVKTVHNGIEYGVMQVIAEAYDILRRGPQLKAAEIADIFAGWNEGPAESFLVDLTAKILTVEDPETGRPLVDVILDRAGQKGTGKWAVESALDLGIAAPVMAAALDARVLSSMKSDRVHAEAIIRGVAAAPVKVEKEELIHSVHDGLYAAMVSAYAEGLNLIRAASREYGWEVDLKEIARIWTGGCIIRARLLVDIMRAYRTRADLPHLFLDEEIHGNLETAQPGWRLAVAAAVSRGIPVPALGSSLAYFDSYRTADLPQNLTQAQRDAFGSHTYRRSDRPEEDVHTDWLGSWNAEEE